MTKTGSKTTRDYPRLPALNKFISPNLKKLFLIANPFPILPGDCGKHGFEIVQVLGREAGDDPWIQDNELDGRLIRVHLEVAVQTPDQQISGVQIPVHEVVTKDLENKSHKSSMLCSKKWSKSYQMLAKYFNTS